MFKKILVSLDGSELAAQALEPAFRVAEKFNSQVYLLRVVSPEEIIVTAPGLGALYYDVRDSRMKREWAEAESYLYGVKMQWLNLCCRIETEVLAGAPPETILDRTLAHHIDLVVMSTHGRSGISRLLYGSVAEAVLRGTHLPVLLIPAKP